jgi:hypothetical protein
MCVLVPDQVPAEIGGVVQVLDSAAFPGQFFSDDTWYTLQLFDASEYASGVPNPTLYFELPFFWDYQAAPPTVTVPGFTGACPGPVTATGVVKELGGTLSSLQLTWFIVDCNGNGQCDDIDIQLGISTDCNFNGIPDECEAAPELLALVPHSASAAISTQVSLQVPGVPDGPANLELGLTTLPITVVGGTANVVIPPLGYAASSDVTENAKVSWSGPCGLSETAPLPSAFTWQVPALISVTPGAVPFDVASSVFIELAGSVVNYGVGSVRFNGLPGVVGTWFEIAGTTYVTTIAPAQLAPGDYPIELEITSGSVTEFTRSESRGLVFLGPGINGMSAISGFQGGGESVTFDLVDFVPGTPITVDLGSAQTSGTPTGYLAASSLTVTTPIASVPGVVDITLTQDLGGGVVKSVTSPSAWEFLPPTVSLLSVVSGPQAGATPVVATTEGFDPGLIDLTLGGVTFSALVAGVAPAQTISFSTPSATAPGLSDVRFVQGVFDVTMVAGFDFLQPSVSSVSPDNGAWYEANTLTVHGQNFAPNVGAEVILSSATTPLGGDPPLTATVVDASTITVDLPAEFASGAGAQDVIVRQGSVEAALVGGWKSLPSVQPYLTGDAATGGQLDIVTESLTGGVLYLFEAPQPGAFLFPLNDMHFAFALDLATASLSATGALLVNPTFAWTFGPGALPSGLTVYYQGLAVEFPSSGMKLSFTEVSSIFIP